MLGGVLTDQLGQRPTSQAEWPLAPPVRHVSVLIPPASCLTVEVPDPTTILAYQTSQLLSRPSRAVVQVAQRIAAFGNLPLGDASILASWVMTPFLPPRHSCPGPGLKATDENEQNSRLAGPLSSCFHPHVTLGSLPSPASGFPTEGRELGMGARSPRASGLRSRELSS